MGQREGVTKQSAEGKDEEVNMKSGDHKVIIKMREREMPKRRRGRSPSLEKKQSWRGKTVQEVLRCSVALTSSVTR